MRPRMVRPISIKERVGGFFSKFLPQKKTKSDAADKAKPATVPAPDPDPKKKDTDK